MRDSTYSSSKGGNAVLQYERMKWLRSGFLVCFAAIPLHAGLVDISSSESVLVRTGSTLSFEVFTWNYAANALCYGLPLYPTDLTFALVTSRWAHRDSSRQPLLRPMHLYLWRSMARSASPPGIF